MLFLFDLDGGNATLYPEAIRAPTRTRDQITELLDVSSIV